MLSTNHRHKQSPIQQLHRAFQQYLYMPDPTPLHAAVVTYIANLLPGNPVWMMLVGPPSCGGTSILNTFRGLPGIVQCGDVSIGGLLSATSKKDKSKQATGGLLMELLNRDDGTKWGVINAKDFTSTLILDQQERKKVLGALKEIYDGHWDRNKGVDGGLHLSWAGKAGFITKCTEMIDDHRQDMTVMGDRFIYCRYAPTDGVGEASKALSNGSGSELMEANLRDTMKDFLDVVLPYDWEHVVLSRKLLVEENELEAILKHEDVEKLAGLSIFAARGRGFVKRHQFTREVERVEHESPGRIAGQLRMVLLASQIAGLKYSDTWKLVDRIVWSCLPKPRQVILQAMMDLDKGNGKVGSPHDFKSIMLMIDRHYGGCGDETFMRRCMQELILQGLVTVWVKGNAEMGSSNGDGKAHTNSDGGKEGGGVSGVAKKYRLSKLMLKNIGL